MQIINVNLHHGHFNILIHHNLLERIGSLVGERWNRRKIALITDDQVTPSYTKLVRQNLVDHHFIVHTFTVPSAESSKSLTKVANIIKSMAKDGFNRSDGVIALGGGVICDLAGFIASIYMRGIALIQIPTSLLAQTYSSVSVKNSINLGQIKDLIGRLHNPDLVIIDLNVLRTLSKNDLANGYGEIVKLAALRGGKFWKLIRKINSAEDILQHAELLITWSIHYELHVISNHQRQVLSLGHFISHGLENLSHGKINHGKAVGISLVAMSKIFEQHNLSSQGLTNQIKNCLEAVGMPIRSSLLGNSRLLNAIYKKMHQNLIQITYLKDFGDPVVKSFSKNQIKLSLHQLAN